MILSSKLVSVLKNFSRINKSIVLDGGECIKTASLNEAILGVFIPNKEDKLKISESIGIYDLVSFISSVMSVGDNTDVDFSGNKIKIKNNNYEIAFGKTELELIQNGAIERECKKLKSYSNFNAEMTLEDESFKKILSVARAMNFDIIEFNESEIRVFNNNNPLANTFSLKIKYDTGSISGFKLSVDNMLMLPGNYKISLTEDTVAKFTNLDFNSDGEQLFYYVAPIE